MTRTSKELLALTLGLGLGLAGCNKSNPPGVASVEFVSPLDGGVLTADAGTVSNGQLSFEVTANVSNAPIGSTLHLKANGFATGNPVNAPASGSGEVTLSATLAGADPATPYVLEIDLDSSTSPGGPPLASASINIGIRLTSNGACHITISPAGGTYFNETGTPIQTFNTVQDEDLTTAGMQAKITVAVAPPCADGIPVTLTVGSAAALTATLTGGVATFDKTLLPDTPITAPSTPSQALSVVAAAGTGADASSDPISYYVYSQNPTISITSPSDAAVFPQTDNPIDVMGVTDLAAQLQLFPVLSYSLLAEDGGAYGNGTLESDGGFSLPVTLPVDADLLTAEVTDAFENVGTSAPVTVTITAMNCSDAGTPTVMFTLPGPDAGYNLADDENGSAPGFQTPLKLMTSSPTGLIEVCSTVPPTATGAVACGFDSALWEIGTTTVSGGTATLDSQTLGDDGAAPNQTLTAQVTDACGTTAEGSVTIEVHALRPVIESVVVQNDFVGSDGGCFWLNAADLKDGTAQTTVAVTVDGADEFADGGPLLAITGTTNQNDSAPLTGTGSPSAEIPISLPDGVYSVSATITDVWGNVSASAGPIPLCVKTSLPTCTVSDAYSNSCFNIQDNGGTAANGAVPVMITVTATNAAAADMNGTVDGTATVTTNGASTSDAISSAFTFSLNSNQGSNIYTATVSDPACNPAATCVPATLNLNVQTEPPTFTVTPQKGGPADAAKCVTYSTRDGIMIDVTTTDIADGTTITVQATGPNGGSTAKTPATVSMNSASVTLNGLPDGDDTLVVSGTDSCLNSATNNAVCIGVTGSGCDLSLVTPVPTDSDAGESVIFNATQVTGGTASIELHTGCAAGTQVQFDSTASGGSDIPQDGGVDANGNVTFNLTGLVDGSSGTFTSDISGGESLPTISYDAKLSLPAIASETPAAGTLEIVANQDNCILGDAGVTTTLAIAGGSIVANEAQCTTSACADFTISGITGLGPVEGNGNVGTASLALSFGGGTTNPSPIPIDAGTTTVTFSGVSMPAVGSGTVTLTLADNAGNTTTEAWTVTTDSLQPPAPVLSASMSDKRTASVNLTWTLPASNGDSATAGYELAYVINSLQATPPGTPTETAYATWTLDPGISDAGNLTYTETNLPTLNQYTFELRALDAVCNRSPLAADATAVSVSGANPSVAADTNAWQTLVITENDGNEANSDFGFVLRTGDFNGDGMQDLVITAPYQFAANPTPGVVYIMNGDTAANLAKVTFAGLSKNSITLGGTDYDFFGQDAHAANYHSKAGAKVPDDLVVGAPYYNSGQGRIDIFFGHNPGGLSTSPDVTILGDSTQTGYFGYSVGAVDVNGDGIADLLVGAPGASSGAGALYVFLTPTGGAWASPDAGLTFSSANCAIGGNPGDGLGAHGITAIDDSGDFAVGAPGGGGSDDLDAGSGAEYGFSAAAVLANASLSTSDGGALFTIVGPGGPCAWGYTSVTPDVAGEPLWECYGVGAIGNMSFTQGTPPALIVSSSWSSTPYLYDMTASGPVDGGSDPAFQGSEGGALGWTMVASDINGDTHPDLLAGPNDTSTGVYLFLNTGTGLTTPASGVIPSPGDGSYFGYAVTAGDLQGIGKQDFAISDDFPSPYVNVYY